MIKKKRNKLWLEGKMLPKVDASIKINFDKLKKKEEKKSIYRLEIQTEDLRKNEKFRR